MAWFRYPCFNTPARRGHKRAKATVVPENYFQRDLSDR